MSHLEPLLRYWRAQDDLFGGVERTWWGAVVSDPRYPRILEANYARVETESSDLTLAEVEEALLPAMAASGCERSHVVLFHPEALTGLLAEAGTRGDKIEWDSVMEFRGAVRRPPDDPTEEVGALDDAFWRTHRESARHFEIDREETLDQLQAIERDVVIPAGRRWFLVGDRGHALAFAALFVLEGVGYLDHVVTLPEARRRGLATALTLRALREAKAAGAERTYLLAEPGGIAERMYRRLGFRRVAQLASWVRPPGRS